MLAFVSGNSQPILTERKAVLLWRRLVACKARYVNAFSCTASLCPATACSTPEEEEEEEAEITSFCQPTRLITCANYDNHVQIFMKSRQSTT